MITDEFYMYRVGSAVASRIMSKYGWEEGKGECYIIEYYADYVLCCVYACFCASLSLHRN